MKSNSFGVDALSPSLLDAFDADESLNSIATFVDKVREKMGLTNCIYHCPTLRGFDLAGLLPVSWTPRKGVS